jgi:hypothetical protein
MLGIEGSFNIFFFQYLYAFNTFNTFLSFVFAMSQQVEGSFNKFKLKPGQWSPR